MAKFYLRLVFAVSTFFVFITLGVMMIPATVDYDVSDGAMMHVGRGVPGYLGNQSNIQNHDRDQLGTIAKFNNGFTLVTDDNATLQEWPWPETKLVRQACDSVDYGHLPDLSVIICFHGSENVSNVLHTVHGVYQRTPVNVLREIILIDDNSMKDDFGQTFELYLHTMFPGKVRIHRSPVKMGLIRARLEGIRLARAEVVAVMDSHVEVQRGWAEPLLYEIKTNPKTLAASYIDWMTRKGDTWEYRFGGTTWKTYFDWTFIFGWQTMSTVEISARKSIIEPIKAPVIIGTIYAIGRKFFEDVGAFDPSMKLWGGENLDLPVRVWLCGGRVINVPCSRAGHLEVPGHRDYRQSQTFIDAKFRNYKRFAEVWADSYKKYFYMYTPNAQQADAGDLGDRLRLRSVCTRDFSWYLDHVFPELGNPDRDGLAMGPLRNLQSGLCLDTQMSLLPGMFMCGTGNSRQGMYWDKNLHLRFPIHIFNSKDLSMFGVSRRGLYMDEYITYHNMSTGTNWFHWQNGLMLDLSTELCLEADDDGKVFFSVCDVTNRAQLWSFQRYNRVIDYDGLLRSKLAENVQTSVPAMLKQAMLKYKQFIPQISLENTKRTTRDFVQDLFLKGNEFDASNQLPGRFG